MGLFIYLDDERNLPANIWPETIVCRTAEQALDLIQKNDYNISGISFDHDLGEGRMNGYELACKIEDMVYNKLIKKKFWVRVHSMNPVGVQNIKDCMRQITTYFLENKDDQ